MAYQDPVSKKRKSMPQPHDSIRDGSGSAMTQAAQANKDEAEDYAPYGQAKAQYNQTAAKPAAKRDLFDTDIIKQSAQVGITADKYRRSQLRNP